MKKMQEKNTKIKDRALRLLNSLITDKTTKADLDTINYLKRLVRADLEPRKAIDNCVEEFFEKTWKIYPRKIDKVRAKKVYVSKFTKLNSELAREKARKVYKLLERQIGVWGQENEGQGRKVEYIPHFASWLNANVT